MSRAASELLESPAPRPSAPLAVNLTGHAPFSAANPQPTAGGSLRNPPKVVTSAKPDRALTCGEAITRQPHVEGSRDAKDDIRRLMRQREPLGRKTARNRVPSAQGANHHRSGWARAPSVGNNEVERSRGDANHHRPWQVHEPAITPRSAPASAISRPRQPEPAAGSGTATVEMQGSAISRPRQPDPLLSTDPDLWQEIQMAVPRPATRRRTGVRWAAVLLAMVVALMAWWWMTGGAPAQQIAGRENRPALVVSANPLRELTELTDKPCPQWTAADVSTSSQAPVGFDWGSRDGDSDGRPCETRTPDGIRETPCGQWTAADRSIAAVAPVGFDWGDRDSDGDGQPCETSAPDG